MHLIALFLWSLESVILLADLLDGLLILLAPPLTIAVVLIFLLPLWDDGEELLGGPTSDGTFPGEFDLEFDVVALELVEVDNICFFSSLLVLEEPEEEIEDIEDDDESELGERLILFLVPLSPPCFSPIL